MPFLYSRPKQANPLQLSAFSVKQKSHKRHLCHLWDRLAGVEGIEPSSGVLETLILPMNYAPICNFAQQRYLYHKPTDMSNNNCKIYTKEKDSAIAFALSVFPLFSHCIKTFKRAPA